MTARSTSSEPTICGIAFGETKAPELYRITYDGSIADEPHFVVMGGTTEPIAEKLNESYTENAGLSEAARIDLNFAPKEVLAGLFAGLGANNPQGLPTYRRVEQALWGTP